VEIDVKIDPPTFLTQRAIVQDCIWHPGEIALQFGVALRQRLECDDARARQQLAPRYRKLSDIGTDVDNRPGANSLTLQSHDQFVAGQRKDRPSREVEQRSRLA